MTVKLVLNGQLVLKFACVELRKIPLITHMGGELKQLRILAPPGVDQQKYDSFYIALLKKSVTPYISKYL